MSTEDVWNNYAEEAYRYFLQQTNDKETAADLRQELFLRIHRSLDKLRQHQKIEHWLRTVSRNLLVDHWKSKGKSAPELIDMSRESGELDHLATSCVYHSIQKLPADYAVPLRMSDLEGVKQAEIAQKLGLGLSATKSRIQRARIMLRDQIKECCQVQLNERNEIVDSACRSGDCATDAIC